MLLSATFTEHADREPVTLYTRDAPPRGEHFVMYVGPAGWTKVAWWQELNWQPVDSIPAGSFRAEAVATSRRFL